MQLYTYQCDCKSYIPVKDFGSHIFLATDFNNKEFARLDLFRTIRSSTLLMVAPLSVETSFEPHYMIMIDCTII